MKLDIRVYDRNCSRAISPPDKKAVPLDVKSVRTIQIPDSSDLIDVPASCAAILTADCRVIAHQFVQPVDVIEASFVT